MNSRRKKVVIVGALLMLPSGKWVLQRRTDDAPTDPGKLSFFGGHPEPGETLQQAFERELSEEIGHEITAYSEVGEYVAGKTYPVDREVHLFKAAIPNMDFEVYEGVRAEGYTPAELRERTDLSEVATMALEKFGGK